MRARANAYCRVPGPPRTAAAGASHQRPRGSPASAQLAIIQLRRPALGQRASSRPRCDSVAVKLPNLHLVGESPGGCSPAARHGLGIRPPATILYSPSAVSDPFCRPRYSRPAFGKFKRALPPRAKCRSSPRKVSPPPQDTHPAINPVTASSTQAPFATCSGTQHAGLHGGNPSRRLDKEPGQANRGAAHSLRRPASWLG